MYVSVCVCVLTHTVSLAGVLVEKFRQFFTILVGHKKLSNDVFGDVVAHDLDLLFEGQRFESRQFWYIKRCYLANGDM